MGLFLTLPKCHSSSSMINPLGNWNYGQEPSWIKPKGKFALFLSKMCWDLLNIGTKDTHSEDVILSHWSKQTRITPCSFEASEPLNRKQSYHTLAYFPQKRKKKSVVTKRTILRDPKWKKILFKRLTVYKSFGCKNWLP